MDPGIEGANITLRQEQISYAYIDAIATTAGYAVTVKHRFVDHAGIDISIEVPGMILDCLSPTIDAQVKCTSQDCIREDKIHYRVKSETYTRLIHPKPQKPQILIVVLVPKEVSQWMRHSKKLDRVSTLIKASAYWISLKNWPQIENRTKTIHIPLSKRLTSETLQGMMEKVAQEEDL